MDALISISSPEVTTFVCGSHSPGQHNGSWFELPLEARLLDSSTIIPSLGMVWLPAVMGPHGPYLVSISLLTPLKIVSLFFRAPFSVLGHLLTNQLREPPLSRA